MNDPHDPHDPHDPLDPNEFPNQSVPADGDLGPSDFDVDLGVDDSLLSESDLAGSEAQFPSDAEPAASHSSQTEVAANGASASSLPEAASQKVGGKSSRLIPILIGVSVVGVASIAWLGWSYFTARAELDSITADLLAARDRAAATSGQVEDAGESQDSDRVSARVRAFVLAPWWEDVLVRTFAEGDMIQSQEQASDLAEAAANRSANRLWWTTQVEASDAALADANRTIIILQSSIDDLEDDQPPHPADGGVSDERRTELAEKIRSEIATLTAAQDAALSEIADRIARIQQQGDLVHLASIEGELARALPQDRNPPELTDAAARCAEQLSLAKELLSKRDQLRGELATAIAGIRQADLNTVSTDEVLSASQMLLSLEVPVDARFDSVREQVVQGALLATDVATALAERDQARAWLNEKFDALAAAESVDAVAAFASALAEESIPECELPSIVADLQRLETAIGDRTQALLQLQQEVDVLTHNTVAWEQAALRSREMLGANRIAAAAAVLVAARADIGAPSPAFAPLLDGFEVDAVSRIEAMATAAQASGNWANLANEYRACLDSVAIGALWPTFSLDVKELWEQVSLAEDRMIYEQVRAAAQSPYDVLQPLAMRYLDPSRMRGGQSGMRLQVAKLLEAIEQPGITVNIEGIEWSSPSCDGKRPETPIMVTIGGSFHAFSLGRVAAKETSLLGAEQQLSLPHDRAVEVEVNGAFTCVGENLIFKGSGVLSMDDLRIGGRLALPFWNGGDSSLEPHKLLLVSIPDEEVREAVMLPVWSDPRILVPDALAGEPDAVKSSE